MTALYLPGRRSVQQIQEAVCAEWGITRMELLSQRRQAALCAPRHMGMYLARVLTPLTLPAIGRLFDRDHSTVLHAVDKIDAAARDDPEVAAAVARLLARLAGPAPGGEANISRDDLGLAHTRALARALVAGATPPGSVTAHTRALAEGVLILADALDLVAEGVTDPQALARRVLDGGPEKSASRPSGDAGP